MQKHTEKKRLKVLGSSPVRDKGHVFWKNEYQNIFLHQNLTNICRNKYICLEIFKILNLFEYLLYILWAKTKNFNISKLIYLSRNTKIFEYIRTFVTYWSSLHFQRINA